MNEYLVTFTIVPTGTEHTETIPAVDAVDAVMRATCLMMLEMANIAERAGVDPETGYLLFASRVAAGDVRVDWDLA